MKNIQNIFVLLITTISTLSSSITSPAFNPHPNLGRDILITLAGGVALAGAASYSAYRTYRYFKPLSEEEKSDIQKPEDTRPLISGIGTEALESGKIIATCIVAASLYGIAQDQVTYRHCPEYFTKNFHKAMMNRWPGRPVLDTAKKLFDNNPDNPTLRASIWGVVASWWMGAIIGVPVTLACRLGSWPKMEYKDLIKPLAYTMGLTGASTLYAGIKEYNNQQQPGYFNLEGIDDVKDKLGFTRNLAAHEAAYAAGPVWSIGLIAHILKTRYKLANKIS
jgi:hypothetical protein